MTAKQFLETRALQIWQTWAKNMPGEVIFFVSERTELSSKIKNSGMKIISLRGVDDSYPPQKKSFAMLRLWMYDNRYSDFNWFLRADDDLYIRSEKLANFLHLLDPSKVLLLGQAGLGNVEEYGQLSLGTNDNYCMGGPGVILSKETLRQLAPYLEQCLNSLLTTHEDVELGRCISLFHNNASIANLFTNHLSASINSHTLRHLFTLHPVKNPIAMRYIHLRVEMIKLSELRQKRMELMEQIEEIKGKNKKSADQQPQIINSEYSGASSNHNALFSGLIPKVPTSPENIFDEFNLNALQKGRTLNFQRVQYGYMRIQPTFGVDFVLDIALRYHRLRGPLHSRAPITVRRHAYVQQRFDFNRGAALSAGIALLPPNALLLLADVDILIGEGALERIRLNTVLGKQVYFPIVFSEYSPTTWKLNTEDFYSQQRGYFRHFGYGIVSLYKKDFDLIGGFNQTIKGWGLEDVDFFEKVIKSGNIIPFRSVDNDLIHIFHSIDCNKNNKYQNKAQKEACEGTRAQGIASLDFLAEQFGPNL
uniref:Hexosyltransferase n=1 Tax=Meloidogyne javanica TaxID=6303 RepID=A0A915MA59_MELJA